MTFEMFVWKAQSWAMGLQTKKPGNLWSALQIALGGLTTQILMQLTFVRCLTLGQEQCKKHEARKIHKNK